MCLSKNMEKGGPEPVMLLQPLPSSACTLAASSLRAACESSDAVATARRAGPCSSVQGGDMVVHSLRGVMTQDWQSLWQGRPEQPRITHLSGGGGTWARRRQRRHQAGHGTHAWPHSCCCWHASAHCWPCRLSGGQAPPLRHFSNKARTSSSPGQWRMAARRLLWGEREIARHSAGPQPSCWSLPRRRHAGDASPLAGPPPSCTV